MFGCKKRFPLPYIYRDRGAGLHYLLMLTSLSGDQRFLGRKGIYYSNPRDSRAWYDSVNDIHSRKSIGYYRWVWNWHERHSYIIQYVVLYRDTLCYLTDYKSLFEYTPREYKAPDFKIGAQVIDKRVLVPDDCIDFERLDEWAEDFWSNF